MDHLTSNRNLSSCCNSKESSINYGTQIPQKLGFTGEFGAIILLLF